MLKIFSRPHCAKAGLLALGLFLVSAPTFAASVPVGLVDELVSGSLSKPTALAFAPDGRIFVTQQTGALRVVKAGALLPTPFFSITTDSTSERGLLGVAVDPVFAQNSFVYVYYTVPGSPAHNRISRFTANGDVAIPGSEVVLMDLEPLSAGNHNGGGLHFGPDGHLYVGVGDNAIGSNAQSLATKLGKMLRISKTGSIPADNPFVAQGLGDRAAIWALGLRNPYTFAFQPGSGRLFINDVGQSTWEEVNDGISGSNYGWPTFEGPSNDPGVRAPIFAYGHAAGALSGCAIVGGTFVPTTSPFNTAYAGRYLFADLCAGWIQALNPTSGTPTVIATGVNQPIDLGFGVDGALYYVHSGDGGNLRRIRSLTAAQVPASSAGSQLVLAFALTALGALAVAKSRLSSCT